MPIPSVAQYRLTYIQQIQPYLAEPILAVGFISTAGYASGLVGHAVLGKAIKAPTVWARSAFRVTAEERGRMSQHLHVDFANGERLDVDVNFSKGEWATFNDPMLALLTQPRTPV